MKDYLKMVRLFDNAKLETKFHNEEVMQEAIEIWMKEHVSHIKAVIERSKKGFTGYLDTFPSIDTKKDIGYGYKLDIEKSKEKGIKEVRNLTHVKVVLKSDGKGGFILHTAYPTIKDRKGVENFKYRELATILNPYDLFFDEYAMSIIETIHHDHEVCTKKKFFKEKCFREDTYLIIKKQLEELLEKRDLNKIEQVMIESDNQKRPFKKEIIIKFLEVKLFTLEEIGGDIEKFIFELKERNAVFIEQIYYKMYGGLPNFKSELILTTKHKLAGWFDL